MRFFTCKQKRLRIIIILKVRVVGQRCLTPFLHMRTALSMATKREKSGENCGESQAKRQILTGKSSVFRHGAL